MLLGILFPNSLTEKLYAFRFDVFCVQFAVGAPAPFFTTIVHKTGPTVGDVRSNSPVPVNVPHEMFRQTSRFTVADACSVILGVGETSSSVYDTLADMVGLSHAVAGSSWMMLSQLTTTGPSGSVVGV